MSKIIELLPSGITFESEGNILNDALAQSVTLEYSCKTGDCGTCSAEIISGTISNEEDIIVTSGSILTCKSKALSDATLRANYFPELSAQTIKTIPCKVKSIENVCDDILIIKFKFPPTVSFDYLPGQYIDLNYKGVSRSYSIANANQTIDSLELHVRKVLDGAMSSLLFSGLEVGQLMRIEGPKGTFFMRKSSSAVIFLAGGTGIAPVKAMVDELLTQQDDREIHIYWGMPKASSFYLGELKALASNNSKIKYHEILSGEDTWGGRKGFVHQAVCEDFPNLADYQVYACGSPIMINAAKQAFLEKQLPVEHFYSDAFTPAH